MSTEQLIGDNYISGGLRAYGADIDWIKTDRPFRILPAVNEKASPVIWLEGELD